MFIFLPDFVRGNVSCYLSATMVGSSSLILYVYDATLMIGAFNAREIRAIVLVVKLWRPVSHLLTSDSRFPNRFASSRCVIPLRFNTSSMRSAMANESSNAAFRSSGTAARHSRNNVVRIIYTWNAKPLPITVLLG